MTPNSVTNVTKIMISVKKRVFDLLKFEKVTLAKEVEFLPVSSIPEAVSRLGNDEKKFLDVVNSGLKRQARIDAKAEMSSENAGSPKVISQFVATFRLMPQFATIADKKEQTLAIYAFLKSTPALFEGIKAAASAALATETEEDEDESEE